LSEHRVAPPDRRSRPDCGLRRSAVLLSLCALLGLGACGAIDAHVASIAPPPVDPYQRALFQGYTAAATAEANRYHFSNAHYYAERARAVSRGESVGDPVANRQLSAADNARIDATVRRLRIARVYGATERYPDTAVAAMLKLECWVQALEEGRVSDGAACEQDFTQELGKLERQLGLAAPPQGLRVKAIRKAKR